MNFKVICLNLVGVVYATWMFGGVVNSLPFPASPSRWTDPCGGSKPASNRIVLPSLSPVVKLSSRKEAFELMVKTEEMKAEAILLKAKYERERIESGILLSQLNARQPLTDAVTLSPLDTTHKFVDILIKDYKRTSVIVVFLEKMKHDEPESSKIHIRKLESYIYKFLCYLHQAIKSRHSGEISYVSSEVMPESLRTMSNESERSARDYVILRDAVTLFNSMEQTYRALAEKNQS